VTARLSIEADVRRLADARRFVREQASGGELDADAVEDLVQAVDEAVTNVVEHGYRGSRGSVEIEVTVGTDAVVVRIVDGCGLFDPTTLPTPDVNAPLDRRRLGGMGVHLARTLTDEMHHRMLPDGGNELTLVKRRAERD
jgi:serine/threonine-protein kinase RsbW